MYLAGRGVSMALVSDYHLDIRPEFDAHGVLDLFEGVVLSFEEGYQKPEVRMFDAALMWLDADPDTTSRVGGNPLKDGAAAQLGIDTLILPPQPDHGVRGLDAVVRLVG